MILKVFDISSMASVFVQMQRVRAKELTDSICQSRLVSTLAYIVNDHESLLCSPDKIWSQNVGDFVGHTVAQQVQSTNNTGFTKNVIRA